MIRPPREGTLRAEGVFATSRPRDLWARCKTRKAHKCWVCRNEFPKGSTLYRPMSNGLYRSQRICEPCVERLHKRGEAGE